MSETPSLSAAKVRCRSIGEDDLAAVVALLEEGFPNRPRAYWTRGLSRLAECGLDPAAPKYGYVLEAGGDLVGVILTISSVVEGARGPVRRCILSSWYVRPAYRGFASPLVFAAIRRKDVTYTNVSAARHTWPAVEAQGFQKSSGGLFFAAALLGRGKKGVRADIFDAASVDAERLSATERDILSAHASFGCLSVICAAPEAVQPFVFQPMRIKGGRVPLPCAQMLYCRDPRDFVRCAAPLGRLLFRRLKTPIVVLDACGPVEGVVGIYDAGRRPKFFKGEDRPRPGDLAFSELAVFGA